MLTKFPDVDFRSVASASPTEHQTWLRDVCSAFAALRPHLPQHVSLHSHLLNQWQHAFATCCECLQHPLQPADFGAFSTFLAHRFSQTTHACPPSTTPPPLRPSRLRTRKSSTTALRTTTQPPQPSRFPPSIPLPVLLPEARPSQRPFHLFATPPHRAPVPRQKDVCSGVLTSAPLGIDRDSSPFAVEIDRFISPLLHPT